MNQKIKQAKNKTIIREIILNFLTVVILTAIIGYLTYFLNRPTAEMIRNTVTFLWGCFVILFLWYQSKLEMNLEYDNQKHPLRFFVVFVICFFVLLEWYLHQLQHGYFYLLWLYYLCLVTLSLD